MLIGIDVGGTFTDGVLFDKGAIIAAAKRPTNESNLKISLWEVLDELLKAANKEISRIVLSTTLITNMLATGRGERTALVLMSGHGLPPQSYDICSDVYFIQGSVDFRGNIIEAADKNEILNMVEQIKALGIKRVAIAGKFSNRNNSLEKQVQQAFAQKYPDILVIISSEISNKLNFPRRAATAYYTAMTIAEWKQFADEIDEAVKARNLTGEVHILKADGGTIPLEVSRNKPCETVFSGPAASTMGGLALTLDKLNSVVLDIGGTTSDISLLIGGQPLYASKGANIEGKYTQVNAFAVRSAALGGDSSIELRGTLPVLGTIRHGAAACFGGPTATVTDAFNFGLGLGIGQANLSQNKLEEISLKAGIGIDDLCSQVIDQVIRRLQENIEAMFKEWENEPAYKVWEVVNKKKFVLQRIIGIGAAAPPIVPLLAERMGVEYCLHTYSDVANALGASVVRPTLAVDVHVDTPNDFFTVDPGGYKGSLNKQRNFQLEDARQLARQYLKEIGQQREMEGYLDQSSFYMEEQFNVIRGWDRVGKLLDVGIEISPGFIAQFKGVSK
ncbi:MAG: hydantoinase/oxoprolinase family protein [Syntrophomonadaceae bacterium]|nr:hydantoinase/oxoprolinase family protein [Syntrophomonadaceae bacterium]